MNKVEIIKGIETTIEGLEAIKKALTEVDNVKEEAPKSKSVVRREQEQKETPVESEESAVVGKFSEEDLKAMKYNDFKKLASSLGVKCTGTRDEIMERILALDVVETEDDAEVEEQEEVVEETPTKSDKSSGVKKLGKKKSDEEEVTKDEFDEQAEEIASETDVEEIIKALSDVDIKANKKNAITLLAKALREGLIELDDEDEDSEEVDTEEKVEDGEISATSYFPEFDPKGYNNPDEMTEERAEAIEAKMDSILTAYSEEELTGDDITSYIEDNATDEEIELLDDDYEEEDLLKMYMELIKRTIDNDGEEHEQGEPYEVADKDVCCGHELKYSKKTKKYICETCGTEYEAK